MPDIKFSNQYPYTDFHELNLDWVIKEVKYWSERVGKSIQKIELTGTVGLVDTYTITYSDGTTSTFDVTNGNGIASVAKTGTVGLVDTYTITFQDGSTSTFEVTNGAAAVDPTLSLSDYAADAKVTGDELLKCVKGLITEGGDSYKNFDNAPTNKVITYVPDSTYSNYPTLEKGNLITFNGYSTTLKNGTSQVYITNSGIIYTRTTWNGSTWSAWKTPTYDGLIASFAAGGDQYKNLNNAPNNTIITYAPDSSYSNYPVLTYGNLITFNAYSPTLKNGTSQLYITQDGVMYSRTTWNGSTWSPWIPHNYSLVPSFNVGGDNYKNLDDAPINKIITYVPDNTYSNYPTDVKGNLITLSGYQPNSKAGTSQLYIDNNGRMFARTTWNGTTWSAWREAKTDKIQYDDYVRKYSFSGKTAVFFGDSITAGYIGGGTYISSPYPVLFANYVGMTAYNEAVVNASFAPSGITNEISAQITGSTHTSADFVFIACGVNDWNAGNSLADVETYVNSNIDYVLANYPNAEIIFITPINNNRDVEGNVAPLSDYINVITRCAIEKDNTQRISVVQGYKFLFPTVNDDLAFRSLMFADMVHPSEFGHKTAYLNGLIKALLR